jgi:hypothetical protein
MKAILLAASAFAASCAPASSFVSVSPMAATRQAHTATLLTNGLVLVAGGAGLTNVPPFFVFNSSAEIFDPATGHWRTTGSMTTARSSHTATLLTDGQVLVAGGDRGNSALSSAEIYDPATGLWAATGPMIISRAFHQATLLTNGEVLVMGGQNNAGTVQDSEVYDPITRSWTLAGSLSTARSQHTATLLTNGPVLLAGGEGDLSNPLSSAELYDPATRAWTTTNAMTTNRFQHTATLLSNGQVLVAAGGSRNLNVVSLSSAELYDPATGRWKETGGLNSARISHTASLLNNGQVLVAGGQDNSGFLSSAELYDPTTAMWTVTASLNSARNVHTATTLPNGQVMVAGGSLLSSVEVYVPTAGIWKVTCARMPTDSSFHISFASIPGALFHILATANPALPLTDWNILGGVTEVSPGRFQFSDSEAANSTQRFYSLVSP